MNLTENTIAIGLLSLILTLGLQVTTPSLRLWSAEQNTLSVEQAGTVVTRRLEHELLATPRTSVTTATNAVSFLTGQDYDTATGKPIFTGYAVYYVDSGQLYRKLWPNPNTPTPNPSLPYTFPTTRPTCLTSDQLALVIATPDGTEQRLATGARSLTATLDPSGSVAVSLDLNGPTGDVVWPLYLGPRL